MAERSAKIEGARAEAASVESLAKHDLEHYKAELMKARAEIYQEQEAARQVVLDERAKLLKAMRSRAQEEILTARKKLEVDMAAATVEADALTPALARDIARSILGSGNPSGGGARR
jgi:F0F1-type ATP synthase membrane subunit b/b'